MSKLQSIQLSDLEFVILRDAQDKASSAQHIIDIHQKMLAEANLVIDDYASKLNTDISRYKLNTKTKSLEEPEPFKSSTLPQPQEVINEE